MKKILSSILFFLILLIIGSVSPFLKDIQGDPIDKYRQIMEAADQLYKERGDLNKALQAYKKYKEAIKEKHGTYEALWKAAKTGFYLMEVLKNKKEKGKIMKEVVQYARQAVETNPDGVEGHFWLGVNYTKVGEIKGVLKALFLISPTKREMRKVIQLNDTYEGGGAYVVLGRVYSQVPGIFGGSDKKARQYYEKARKICPFNSLNLLFLAETYWDLKEKALAVKTLEELLAMEPNPRWIPETKRHKKEARKLLKRYKEE
jgi:tetratricopeptide (TPR) repeat protein